MARKKNDLESIPQSMRKAVDTFILSGAARLSRGQWKNHITMLIHISHLVDSHLTVYEMISEYVEDLRYDIEEKDQSTKDRLKNIWETDFIKTTEFIVGEVELDFKKVWKNSRKFIDELEIIMDNSNSNERLSFDRSLREGAPLWGIIIGGNTLSRGLTLEGLTISYFVRNSMSYDTLLQMGRWFGYRKGYVDLTRIFVPSNLYYAFYELATVEQEIRDEISLMSANGERPIDVALKIRKIPNLNITAGNKQRNTTTTSMSYDGTKIQTWQVVTHNQEIVNSNLNAISSFLRDLQHQNTCVRPAFEDLSNCHLFEKVETELILQLLDRFYISVRNSKFDSKIVQKYIQDNFQGNGSDCWSVAIISRKQGMSIKLESLEVIPVQRNVSHLTEHNGNYESTLRAVSTPGEELIDLSNEIFEKTSKVYNDTNEFLISDREKKLSDTKARHMLRPKSKPLLMIFPLKFESSDSDNINFEFTPGKMTFPLKAVNQVFALSIVFPYCEANTNGRFIKNSTI